VRTTLPKCQASGDAFEASAVTVIVSSSPGARLNEEGSTVRPISPPEALAVQETVPPAAPVRVRCQLQVPSHESSARLAVLMVVGSPSRAGSAAV
jgi:hypothetical protein